MENRVLLAFVLSLVVFVGWGIFLSKVQPPPQKKAVEQQAPVAANPQIGQEAPSPQAGQAPGSVPDSGLTAPLPAAPQSQQLQFVGTEETINVFLGKVTFVLSNKGATIHKVLFNDYLDDTGCPYRSGPGGSRGKNGRFRWPQIMMTR